MTTAGGWDAALVTAKAATYAATLCASGAAFFLFQCRDLLADPVAGRIRSLILGMVPAALLAGGAMILATAASMSGDAAGLTDVRLARMILQAGEGRASLARVAGLALIGLGAAWRRLPRDAAPFASVAAATSFAWVGHVHALGLARDEAWPTLALAVHLSGAAFWLGALVPLYLVAGSGDMPRIAATVGRFGKTAFPVVVAMLLAGTAQLCLVLRDAGDLWSDDYGRLALAKILLAACLLALAAFNRLRLTPRLAAHDRTAVPVFRRSIVAELAVAGCILALTAALTTQTGPPALDMPP